MTTLIQKLSSDWGLMRIFRLLIGGWAIVQAYQTHELAFGILGSFFLFQAITNTGCCGVNSCNTQQTKKKGKETEFIDFEEVK